MFLGSQSPASEEKDEEEELRSGCGEPSVEDFNLNPYVEEFNVNPCVEDFNRNPSVEGLNRNPAVEDFIRGFE